MGISGAPCAVWAGQVLRCLVASVTVLGLSSGCDGDGDSGNSGNGEDPSIVIVIGVTATMNEPAPALSPRAEAVLRDAVAAGEVHLVIYQEQKDNLPATVFDEDISIRRGDSPDGPLERTKGIRDQKFDVKLGKIKTALHESNNDSGRIDVLNLLAAMGRRSDATDLIVVSSGLQTVGDLDLPGRGIDLDVPTALSKLPRNALPSLSGKRVLLTGIGQGAGPQKSLLEPMRQNVENLWVGACEQFDGDCDSDSSVLPADSPVSTTPVPVVPVSEGETAKPRGTTVEISLPYSVLFHPNSPVLVDGADETLQRVAGRFGPATQATAIGHTAHWGEQQGAIDLSRERSHAVVDRLVRLGVSPGAFTRIDGVGFDEPLEQDLDATGRLIPAAAEKNRTVILTLTNPRQGSTP